MPTQGEYIRCYICRGRFTYSEAIQLDERDEPLALMQNAESPVCYNCAMCGNCGRFAATDLIERRCRLCRCKVCNVTWGLMVDVPPSNRGNRDNWATEGMICGVHYNEKYADYICQHCSQRRYAQYLSGENRELPTFCSNCAGSVAGLQGRR